MGVPGESGFLRALGEDERKLQRDIAALAGMRRRLSRRGVSAIAAVDMSLGRLCDRLYRDVCQLSADLEVARHDARMLQAVVDHTSDIVVVKDLDNRYLFVNPAAVAISGMSHAQLLSRGDADFLDGPSLARLREQEHRVLATRGPVVLEDHVRLKDGTERWYLSTKFPLWIDGAIAGIVGLSRDITDRKHMENSLADAHGFLARTLDSLSAHVAIVDEAGTILAVNAAWRTFARRNGLRMPDDGIGADYMAISRQAAAAGDPVAIEALTGIERVLAGRESAFRLTYPCHGPSERNWFLLNATCFRQDGRMFVVLAHENITEQQLAEEATRDRELRFKALLEALPDPLLIIDRAGTIVQVNEQAERSFGYTRDELVGHPVERLIPERRLAAHRRDFPGYFTGPRARPMGPRLDLNARRKDGGEFPIEVTLSPLDTPEGVLIIANVRDATARKQADLATARLAAIVQSSDDSMLSVSLDGRLLSWNAASERLYGYMAAEAIGRPIEALLPIEGPDCWSGCLAAIRRGEAVVSCEVAIRRKDGGHIQVAVTVSPLRDQQGRLIGASLVAKDITRLKAVLQEAAHHAAEIEALRETNKLKDHFLSTISHEMKTPLSLINGYAELLEDVCQEKAWLAGIQEGSRRLTEHLNNVLDYTALLSGTLPIDKMEIAPGELVAQAIDAARAAFAEKGVSLEVAIAPDLPTLCVDPRRLIQMLGQLLDNARKFTPPGGRAGVRAHVCGGELRIAVWDSGVGIPEQDRERIWAAFTQLDIGDALRKGGLGLGLTLLTKLAELHGGRVELESTPGDGSVFTLVLPI